MEAQRELRVAVGVIRDAQGQVLIAQRPAHVHQGGLWEFPGGKLEPGETVEAALTRELEEELHLRLLRSSPLLVVRHVYPQYRVVLEVREVTDWQEEPHGHENQPILWVAPERLPDFAFPAANAPIVTAVRLPETYAILDIAAFNADDLARRFDHLAGRGVTLLQLRAKTLIESDYRRAAAFLLERARGTSVRVLLNAAPELAEELDAHGIHLTSRRLMALRERPLNASRWVAASCHDEEELLHAQRLGVDFAVLAPVRATATHPGATPLGWERFAELCRAVSLPIYALGGLSLPDVNRAREMGGRGIAAIRAFAGER
jgi:8-oxo-dGTP diphosphatase